MLRSDSDHRHLLKGLEDFQGEGIKMEHWGEDVCDFRSGLMSFYVSEVTYFCATIYMLKTDMKKTQASKLSTFCLSFFFALLYCFCLITFCNDLLYNVSLGCIFCSLCCVYCFALLLWYRSRCSNFLYFYGLSLVVLFMILSITTIVSFMVISTTTIVRWFSDHVTREN